MFRVSTAHRDTLSLRVRPGPVLSTGRYLPHMAMADGLTDDERQAIVVAAQSVFAKLRNLYKEIEPVFVRYGFTAPSAGVVARDLSEKIEIAITQHCNTFTKGQ